MAEAEAAAAVVLPERAPFHTDLVAAPSLSIHHSYLNHKDYWLFTVDETGNLNAAHSLSITVRVRIPFQNVPRHTDG